ncbi:putative haloacid dehalogenase-like hydrolase [Cercophora samala]|uniref:Haloacid dehalogenase-like hydrolase n=1 Tax=Cercophora samala TaxID=330535 RepID=A0AA40D1H0_9PEZI|nr:putative haloacid dehalogenase-like hydrolase [Cercophora samala]
MTSPNGGPSTPPTPPKLVIFNFDGTLFDTHDSMTHCISRTFQKLQPSKQPPSLVEIRATIASGAGLERTFRTFLHQSTEISSDADLKSWISTYRNLYTIEGQSLIKPFDNTTKVLRHLNNLQIPVVVIINKGKQTIEKVLKREELTCLIDLVVGDTRGVPPKPNPATFHSLVAPLYPKLAPKDILVVGDTEADILFAKNIGARSCWASYGYGNPARCEALGYGAKINQLCDVLDVISKSN